MRRSTRIGTLALVVVLTASAMTLGSGLTTAAGSQVVVQSVTVDPTTPKVGEDVTVTATIRNFESSSAAAHINQVTLRSNDGIIASADDLGTLGAGGSMDLPLTTSFDTTGRKDLTLWVYGQSEDGGVFTVQYPVTISVREHDSDVQLSLSTPTEPSTEGRVNVTVANGADANISNLELLLDGPNVSVDDPRRVNAALGGGRERVTTYDVTFDGAGPRTLTATLNYRDTDGDRQRITASQTFDVDPPRVDAELDASVVRENGTARIETSLTNFGNVPLEEVRIRAESGGDTVARKLVSDIPAETTRTASISESSLPAGRLRLHASYEANGERHGTTTTVDFAPTTEGNISLTGIEVRPTGGTIRLAGSASNTGETAVTGAVVSVVDTPAVTPVSPAKDYFVGNVPAGEFTSFELTARLTGNRTDAVPVRITYIADGEQHSRVVSVSVDGGAAASLGPPGDRPDDDGPSGGFLGLSQINVVGILLRVVAVVAVGGGVIYWWQRRGTDDRN
ncbi:MAG: hypothetical protein ABEI80_06650 [Haloplanus sp.]